MNDEYVSRGKVIMFVAWGVVATLMATAWVVILFTSRWRVGGMFAAMSCAMSAMAATMQIRCYAVRMACLIRATAGLVPESPRPRPVRDL